MHLARLIRPQGRRGEVLAEILTDFPERFAEMRNAFLWRGDNFTATSIAIEHSWLHKGKVVLKFVQVDSISAAEALRGAELVIPREERLPLQPDAVYIGDLIGCQLIDLTSSEHSNPSIVGTICDVIQQEKTADLLIVAGEDGSEYEIPFAKAYLGKIDLAGRRLEMNLPPGLLEVNAALSEEERRTRSEESGSQP